jgi:acetyl-CoA carboxylase biotin carboxyl carrier protein
MDLKEIKAVIDLMTKSGLSEFELERQDFKLRIKRNANGEFVAYSPTVTAPPLNYTQTAIIPAIPSAPVEVAPATNLKEILSPMVGTFYRSPSPDSAPYVEVGQQINEETVVCIIEAMKVMNEIKSEIKGTVVEVLQESGKPVDYNKPLFRVKSA